MIRQPENNDEPLLRRIWKDVFGDSDEFIDLFFRNRYSPDSALVYHTDGAPVSMLFFPQYIMKAGDSLHKLGYICGAATLPEYRGRGLMAELLNASFGIMAARGDRFTSLIPASDSLYGYYERFGYSTYFYRKRIVVNRTASKIPNPSVIRPADNADQLYEIYSAEASRLPVVVLQSRKSFRSVFDEFILSGGRVFITDDGKSYCFVRTDGTRVYLRESFSISGGQNHLQAMADSLFGYFPLAETVEAEVPATNIIHGSEYLRTGMIRSLHDEGSLPSAGSRIAYMKFMLED
ncbi:MAG: GNAT family N-acetyltransferase [Bacteroidales bacterium]|nr:GNAT family N-acetyltransferase [Bacteroidales bacterium]